MGQSELGNIGFSAAKLEALKTEIGADAVTALKAYINTCFDSEVAQNRKLIQGTLERFALPDSVYSIKDHLLSAVSTLVNVDLTNCKHVGNYAFEKCYNVSTFNVTDAEIESLGEGAFSMLGADRVGAGMMTLDFRKSKFTSLGYHVFGGSDTGHKCKNLELFLPSTLKHISNYAFHNANNVVLHFDGEAPQVMGANVFSGASNVEIYCTWKNAYTYINGTNWSALGTVVGTEGDEFEDGEALPAYDRDGYELTWYSDKAKNNVATTSDGHSPYYCSVGNSKAASRVRVLSDHATVLIKDGDDNVYDDDHPIPYGTEVTITVSHATGYTPYILTINDESLTSGDTWTAASGEELVIIALDTDGVTYPVNPVLAENSPEVIRAVCRKGVALTHWNLGDEVDIELSSGVTATFRLVDATTGRYPLAAGDGYSNAVFMVTKIYWSYQMNSSGTNAGGWPASAMCTTRMANLLALFPDAWKNVISEVSISSATSGNDSTLTSGDTKLFIPNTYEIFGSASYAASSEQVDQFGWYVGKSASDRIMKDTNNNATGWWLRSPRAGVSYVFVFVVTSGGANFDSADIAFGVALCFAI